MNKIKVVFCGTPRIGAQILEALIEMNNVEVGIVISQPDKPFGRKKELKPTPVKQVAIENNIKVIQPIKIIDSIEEIKQYQPDFIVTCAYGQFIPDSVLSIPTIDSINIHGSLLPKYRGGAPIQYAIKNGDTKTGISIMKMVKKMDAGDYFVQEEITINEDDDSGTLFEKMGELGKKMIAQNLIKIYNNELKPIQQIEEEVTFSKNISPGEERINWTSTAKEIRNHIRSLSPNPIAHTFVNNERYKIQKVEIVDFSNKNNEPGKIVDINKSGIVVQTGDGLLNILMIQRSGKKMIEAKNYKLNNLSDLKIGDNFE